MWIRREIQAEKHNEKEIDLLSRLASARSTMATATTTTTTTPKRSWRWSHGSLRAADSKRLRHSATSTNGALSANSWVSARGVRQAKILKEIERIFGRNWGNIMQNKESTGRSWQCITAHNRYETSGRNRWRRRKMKEDILRRRQHKTHLFVHNYNFW